MQFAHINGLTLHYRDEGPPDAPAIAFINSLGTDLRIWDDVCAGLEGFRLVRHDKRGHGLSDCPDGPYQIDTMAADLRALLQMLDISNVILVGLSVGGLISLALTSRAPSLAAGVVLSNTAHKIGDEALWNERIDLIRREGIAAVSGAIMERWFSPQWRSGETAKLAAYTNMLERQPVEGYAATCQAIRDADYTAVAKALAVPALCIAGSSDGSTPPEIVRSCANLIRNSRFELIDGPGHIPCVETPGRVAELIGGFVSENGLG